MQIDIPTKGMVKEMVDDAIRKEMNSINKLLDRFRRRLVEVEIEVKKKFDKIRKTD